VGTQWLRWLGVVIALVLMAGGPGDPPTAHAGEQTLVDGVLHVRNPAEPPDGVERLALEELWRIDEDSELLIGLPTAVAVDGTGRVHVLDAQLNQVHLFTLDGEHLGTRFREGEGPGEIRNPSDMIVAADGTVGILQESSPPTAPSASCRSSPARSYASMPTAIRCRVSIPVVHPRRAAGAC
jgi:hypothetical protein